MIAYGVTADANDDYVHVRESTALESLRRFVIVVVKVFGPEYMRLPNEQDTDARLLAICESRGFPGMLGSIDCICIGPGKIAHLDGKVCIGDIKEPY